ncbi:hypothetical protein FRB90_007123 [Tulasnella sp. 427]|nr:hypothetical protein FRB90_007123 [Tulasnella sp. 427]
MALYFYNGDIAEGRKAAKKLYDVVSAEAIRAVLQAQDELIKSSPTLNRSGVILECTPKKAVAAVPLEATAYSGRGTAAEMSVFLFYADKAVDGLVQNTVRQWARFAAETAPASSASDGLCYGNLDPEAATSDASTVFGPNYKRLREVKRKYDPDNIFNKWHPIQPASLA